MKKIIVLLTFYISFVSCTSSVRIHGELIKQKELCSELGYGKKCNPLPYGRSLILNSTRWSIPIDHNLKNDKKEKVFKNLITQFLGGKVVNTRLLAPAKEVISHKWIDYHYGPLKLDRKYEKTFELEISMPINEILSHYISSNSLSIGASEKAKEELENSFKKFSNSKGTIELVYHSAKLNGNWYNAMLAGDTKALNLVSYPRHKGKYVMTNKIGDSFSYIGGIGVIEYKVSKNDSLTKVFKLALEQKVGLSEKLSLEIAGKISNEVERTTKTEIPNRLDVVFVSQLEPKFTKQ